MNKGVVMEKTDKSIIVMTPSGEFERIPAKNRNCQVGEEILYAARPSGARQPAFAAMSVFVAAVVFCMMLFTGIPAAFADKSVVAYVSIDINPSVELGIDKHEKVREMRGLNDKGLEVVQGLNYKGKSLDDVADKLLQKAEEMNIFTQGEGDIIIASTTVKETSALTDETVSEQLKQQVLAHVVAKHPDTADKIEVTAFSAPAEVRETAKDTGLSVGKYSVYLNAKSTGRDVKVEDLKQDSIHNLAKEAGGLSKLVDATKLQKDSIKELLQEEKSGSLDRKVQDKKKEDEKNKNSSVKPSGKSGSTPGKSSATPTPSKQAPTPTPKPSLKPSDASKATDRNDDRKNQDKPKDPRGDDKNNGDSKDDKTGKPGSSSAPSPGSGSDHGKGKDQDPGKTKDEDRRTGGPSADSKAPTPKPDNGNGKDKKDNKDDKDNKDRKDLKDKDKDNKDDDRKDRN
ncbi:anti-sigma factor domain-containing protein [Gorillibacterium sp. sgz5001074]|uniref:anti-sigma factor domain-containing protein n=1 Tax=Gorillibacterium sp. sgz5001074 TaxID=3446695 RepID=UPI003F66B0B9